MYDLLVVRSERPPFAKSARSRMPWSSGELHPIAHSFESSTPIAERAGRGRRSPLGHVTSLVRQAGCRCASTVELDDQAARRLSVIFFARP
jgi:hypothetical protein